MRYMKGKLERDEGNSFLYSFRNYISDSRLKNPHVCSTRGKRVKMNNVHIIRRILFKQAK